MIAELTASQLDLPEFEELGRAFFKEAGFTHRFEPVQFRSNWKKLMDVGMGRIVGAFSGAVLVAVLGFVVAPDLNDGKTVAYETFWFSHPDHRGHGLRLIRSYEGYARAAGAERMSMVHLNNLNADRLGILYNRMGFRPAETHYFKELT